MIYLLLLYLWGIAYFILTQTGFSPVAQDALERLRSPNLQVLCL